MTSHYAQLHDTARQRQEGARKVDPAGEVVANDLLVLQLGRTGATTLDVPDLLTAVCSALLCSAIIGVASSVILLAEPGTGAAGGICSACDSQAGWIGEAQVAPVADPCPTPCAPDCP